VNPRWALRVAPHLVKFEYHDPLWDPERGQVTAREVITLFGLTLGSERRVDYGRVAPVEARKIFVADALAARQWLTRQLQIQEEALDAQRERARLAKLRYDAGSATFLEVLDAERDFLSAQQQKAQTQSALLSARVAVFAALGGGSAALSAEKRDAN
jgi:HrpA-like RNA helicase